MASAYSFQVNWGGSTILERAANARDIAIAGLAESAITDTGAQISVQSYGTILPFLPRILNVPAEEGVAVSFRASITTAGADGLKLTNYTVLRYPAN
jgi:hypothetical protein